MILHVSPIEIFGLVAGPEITYVKLSLAVSWLSRLSEDEAPNPGAIYKSNYTLYIDTAISTIPGSLSCVR